MPIRVVNVRGVNHPDARAAIVYVGRPFAGWPGHPLANPYGVSRGATAYAVKNALTRYRDWLLARPTLEADLAGLWEETGHGERPLGCWCVECVAGDGSPVRCHAQILAEMLRERFGEGATGHTGLEHLPEGT